MAEAGLHGLTHRALDQAAGVPAGTASNYFPTRDALLIAAAEGVIALHHQEMDRITAAHPPTRRPTLRDAADLIAHSLLDAATTHRARSLAMLELQAEIRRRPELAATLGRVLARAAASTADYHHRHRLPVDPEAIPTIQALFGGALLALLHADTATLDRAHTLATAIIFGAH